MDPSGVVDPCDEDGDGWRSTECSGVDCCDIDNRVPSDDWRDRPNLCDSWDYDCNGEEEPQPRETAYCQNSGNNASWYPPRWLGGPPTGCGGHGLLIYDCYCDPNGGECAFNTEGSVLLCH